MRLFRGPLRRALLRLFAFLPLVGGLHAQSLYAPYHFTVFAGQANTKGGSQDGTGTGALFNQPSGLALDGVGNLYVADTSNHTIRKITSAGVVSTLAGTPGQGGHADGVGAAAQFDFPQGVAVDAAGNVFVADSQNNTIRKIAPDGTVTTLAGIADAQSGFVDGAGASARFAYPIGLVLDSAGNLYVADQGNCAIRVVSPAGVVTTLAGDGSSFYGDGGADGDGRSARFVAPTGIAIDASGLLYVADMGGDTVRTVTPSIGLTLTLAGAAGNPGDLDATGAFARFNLPQAVAVDAVGNVYVADTANATLRRIAPGGSVTTLAGNSGSVYVGAPGIGPQAAFRRPVGVAVAPDGTVYLADAQANTIFVGRPVGPSNATVTLSNLSQTWTGGAATVTVTTVPAGLSTAVYFSGPHLPFDEASAEGTYGVYATVTEPGYTGYANGVLTIGPCNATQPAFAVRHTRTGGSHLWSIAYGPSGLVAVGTGGTILKSADGLTWTPQVSGTSQWLVGVAYGGGQYIAVGDAGIILLSPDGAAWTPVAQTVTEQRLNNVAYGAGVYVAVGEHGTILSSSDGRTWTSINTGWSGWLRGLAYVAPDPVPYILPRLFPARFVASGKGGGVITSMDGFTWLNEGAVYGFAPFNQGPDIEALASAESSEYVGVGDAGTLISSSVVFGGSPPLEILKSDSFFSPVAYRAVVCAPSGLFAAGDGGSIVTTYAAQPSYLPEPPSWYQVPSGTASDLSGGVTVGGTVYFVGDDETIVALAFPDDTEFRNLSCRTQAGTGADGLIAGFVLRGGAAASATPTLIRGSGPALVPFGVQGVLPDPELRLYATGSASVLLAANSGWGGDPALVSLASSVGAFAWPDPTSHDCALHEILPAGSYTANIVGESGDSGVALAEIYDASPAGASASRSPHLSNLSARARVGTGSGVLIAGFVIGGSAPTTVLIRASGPALGAFGVPGVLPDPELQIYSAYSTGPYTALAANTGWKGDPGLEAAAAWVGAFPWDDASGDSAILITLPPGGYTAVVSGASGDGGIALIEVYLVP